MKILTLCCSAALAALTLAGCNPAKVDTQAEIKAISDGETQWIQDWASRDVDKIVAHYADDAVFMSTGTPASNGKAEIRKAFVTFLADPALSIKFKSSRIEVSKSGDMAVSQGSYQMTMTDPATKQLTNDHGSYVTTYAKQADGSWKAVEDIATSEVPPAAPVPVGKKQG